MDNILFIKPKTLEKEETDVIENIIVKITYLICSILCIIGIFALRADILNSTTTAVNMAEQAKIIIYSPKKTLSDKILCVRHRVQTTQKQFPLHWEEYL